MAHDGSGAEESFAERWRRRAVSLPALAFGAGMWLFALPFQLPLAFVVDVAVGNRLALTRTALLVTAYFAYECAGVLASAWLWATRGADRAAFVARNFALQRWWAGGLFAAGERLFGLRVRVDGAEALDGGPILLLVRHASLADTLLPGVFVSSRTGRLLRYVLKRELLFDPCLDIVGQRLPNAFVRRGSADPAREIATVRALAEDLPRDEGVVLFPEGTRFSPQRRADALAKLAKLAASDPSLATRAERLTHTLPPRLGGTLALLDAAPGADVVFCGHVGFDGVRDIEAFANGALVGREVRVVFWRCPRTSIPTERGARVDWLYSQWERMDAWVEENGDALGAARKAG